LTEKKSIRTELTEENQKPLSSASPVLEGVFWISQ